MTRPTQRWKQPSTAKTDPRPAEATDAADADRRPAEIVPVAAAGDADKRSSEPDPDLDLGLDDVKPKAAAQDDRTERGTDEDRRNEDRDGIAAADTADADDADDCREADADCREAVGKLRADTLASISLDIRVGGRPGNDYPCECRLEGEAFVPRQFASTTFTWKAAGYCHKPLYFEQWNLERYGHSYGFVPDFFLSGAHFFVTLPILPYKMGVELPWECVYPLGYYRPGNCAPWTCPAVPISGRGLAVEAATITGAVFLLP